VVMERDSCRKALDGLSDGLHFMDRDRVIRYGNGDAERVVGFDKHEVIGTACRAKLSVAQHECTVNMNN
jgi:transcriptional regulator with PAS, ATPase and Fis domain